MASNDLDMLKAITDQVAQDAEVDGRWESAEKAVDAVLTVLYNNASGNEWWQQIYEAIKSAYVSKADWGDEVSG